MAKTRQYMVVTGTGDKDDRPTRTLVAAESEDEARAIVGRQEIQLWAASNEPARLAAVDNPDDATSRTGREGLSEPYKVLKVEEA